MNSDTPGDTQSGGTPSGAMIVDETVEDDGKVKFSVTIPLEGAAKLRQVQELAGLKSLEDTIRFLLAIYVKRVKEGGYPFGEEGTR